MNAAREKPTDPRVLILALETRRLAGVVAQIGGEKPRVDRFVEAAHPEGFQRGEVVQLDRALQTVEGLLRRLELEDDALELPTYVLLSNPSLKMSRFSSAIHYPGYPRSVTAQEMRRVIEQTRTVAPLPLEDWIIELVPESFWVNDLQGVENPMGLEAQRLAVSLQIYTTAYSSYKNLARLLETLEVNVQGYLPKTLVLPEGVLNAQERESEVLILDLSEGVTHLVLTREGKVLQTKSLEQGTELLTRRVAQTWQLTPRDAEILKERFGSFQTKVEFGEELIPLVKRNGHRNHQIKRAEFHKTFVRSGEELVSQLEREVKEFLAGQKVPYPHYVASGEEVRLEGFIDFLSGKLSRPVRVGAPRPVEGHAEFSTDPAWGGVVGLLHWLGNQDRPSYGRGLKENFLERTFVHVKDWLAAYF